MLAIFSIHCFQNHGLVLPTCSLSASQSAEHLHETGLEARATTSMWSALQATPKSFGACRGGCPRFAAGVIPSLSLLALFMIPSLLSCSSRTKFSDSVSVMASKILPICNRKCFRFQVWSQKLPRI